MLRHIGDRGPVMSCSSCSSPSNSPTAQFLKSHTAQALWDAAQKHQDQIKAENPARTDPPSSAQAIQAATAPGVGLVVDIRA